MAPLSHFYFKSITIKIYFVKYRQKKDLTLLYSKIKEQKNKKLKYEKKHKLFLMLNLLFIFETIILGATT
jgi:hypothetical protein